MWGNARGWTISAVVMVLWAITVAGFGILGAASLPAGFGDDPSALGEIHLLMNSSAPAPGQSGDGTVLLGQAIGFYTEHPDVYDALATSSEAPAVDSKVMAPMALLRQAADMAGPGVFQRDPRSIVSYDNHPAALDALGTLGDALIRIGMTEWPDQKENALADWKAAYSLGNRLASERLTLGELRTGAHLMSESAAELARMDKDHAADWNAQVADLAKLIGHVNDIARQISTLDSPAIAKYAGDVFAFASESSERMWRVEAVLSMGRMRFNIGDGRRADQLAATRLIDQYCNDPDTAVAAAAQQARDLTMEDYRRIGG
jgi:hypothetical protein